MASRFKSGFVAIIGRPNAGKSTLVNTLVGRKVSIVSPRPQTTRNRIQGIINSKNAQIVLIDTPGIHKPDSVLNRQMMDEVTQAIEGIDILALIMDATADFGPGDRFTIEFARRFQGPVFLLLNKIDRMRKQHLLPLIDKVRKEFEFTEIFPVSAVRREGCEELVKSWIAHLPEGPPLFPWLLKSFVKRQSWPQKTRCRTPLPCSSIASRKARSSFASAPRFMSKGTGRREF